MIKIQRRPWFRSNFQLRGSVVPIILERSLFFALFGLLVCILYEFDYPVAQPILGNVIPSIVLALLLVFRTNTAYDRFWEGRKLWGMTVNISQNLTWQIWTGIKETTPQTRKGKIAALRLIAALAIAKKLYLRRERPDPELTNWLSPSQYQYLSHVQNMPLEMSYWLANYLQKQFEQGNLNIYQLTNLQQLIQNYLDNVGGCNRIVRTPIPLAYSILLKQLIFLYCLLIPFQFVQELGWFTGIFMAIISFSLFGIEEIGLQIENPFGYDPNDLPLDTICQNIGRDIEEFINNQNRKLIKKRIE